MGGQLTARKVETLKKPGHYVDGEGLALVIGKRGGKSWVLRTMIGGRRRDVGLGGVSWVSLAQAREKARVARAIAREGGDPIALRRAKTACPSFEEAARLVYKQQIEGHSTNAKHREQWINSLQSNVFPHIGTKSVRKITQSDVLRVLAPIWSEKYETARRIRQRIRTVMDWARAAGHFEGANPVEGVEKGLPRQRDRVKHFAAMPWQEVPGFLPLLGETSAALSLRFLILTAARTGEVLKAQWSEIDWEQRLWTVPTERMKAKREHRVPLSDEALEVLSKVQGLDEVWVFPGQKRGNHLAAMAMSQALKRVNRNDVTVHGFRSSFRDWAEEKVSMPREIAELSLAHDVGSTVERAYRRSDLLDKRRILMERWGRFCIPTDAKVISIGA